MCNTFDYIDQVLKAMLLKINTRGANLFVSGFLLDQLLDLLIFVNVYK